MKRTLIVTAHLDDETFGMGGTIAQMVLEKHCPVRIVSLCAGRDTENAKQRLEAMSLIQEDLSCEVMVYPFFDMELENVLLKDITQRIEEEIVSFNPSRVFTVSETDIHQDHQIVSKATKIACRPGRSNIKELYEFKIPGCEPFTSSYYDTVNDVSSFIKVKQMFADYYVTENKPQIERKEYFRTIYKVMELV